MACPFALLAFSRFLHAEIRGGERKFDSREPEVQRVVSRVKAERQRPLFWCETRSRATWSRSASVVIPKGTALALYPQFAGGVAPSLIGRHRRSAHVDQAASMGKLWPHGSQCAPPARLGRTWPGSSRKCALAQHSSRAGLGKQRQSLTTVSSGERDWTRPAPQSPHGEPAL